MIELQQKEGRFIIQITDPRNFCMNKSVQYKTMKLERSGLPLFVIIITHSDIRMKNENLLRLKSIESYF